MYKLIRENDGELVPSEYGGTFPTKIEIQLDEEQTVDSMVENFTTFLRACGFMVDYGEIEYYRKENTGVAELDPDMESPYFEDEQQLQFSFRYNNEYDTWPETHTENFR